MPDRAYLERLIRSLMDEGKIIEAGWVGLRLAAIADSAPPTQLSEMRMAFFAGAQHLFSSIMSALDPGKEETPGDIHKMSQIQVELDRFEDELRLRIAKPKGRG